MVSFLGALKQKFFPSYLGVDIGTNSIKAVEVKPGTKMPAVVNYGILEAGASAVRANQAIQTSSLKIFEESAVDLLKSLLDEMRPKATEVLASLPLFSAFTTVLDYPDMSPGDLKKSIAYQAREYIPLPISEVALDWLKVGEFTDDQGFKHQQVLLISVPQENIKRYQRIFRAAGLSLRSLEIESLSAARILSGGDPTPTVIVDIGNFSTDIIFTERGELKFTSQSDFAGSSLTQAVAQSLSINPVRAEELKRERGIQSSGPSYELSTIMLPFLDAIINEVKKAIFNYNSQFKGAARKVERIVLTGGGANMAGVEKYVEREFDVPVAKANPFVRFEYQPKIEPFIGELNPLMSVALGLVIREFQD